VEGGPGQRPRRRRHALRTQQKALVELVPRQLLLASVDSWLLMQPSLVNARKKALLPVVRERQQVADTLAKYLAQLGMARQAKPAEDLQTYLARKAAKIECPGDRFRRRMSPWQKTT
jgi:hypothetical protein